MKKYYGILAMVFWSLCFSTTVFSAGGIDGGGTGKGEQNVAFAMLNLDKYLELCLSTPACRLSADETVLLQSIRANLGESNQRAGLLEFRAGKDYPGFFVIDGQLKIARTGYQSGSTIYINTDLLTSTGSRGEVVAISVAEAVSILVHELGHHLGEENHQKLDFLGNKVSSLVLLHTQVIDLGRYQRHIEATLIDFGGSDSFTQLFLSDSEKMIDLTSLIQNQIGMCPLNHMPDFDATGEFPLIGLWINNLHWRKGSNLGSRYEQPMRARVNIFCGLSGGEFAELTNFEIDLTVVFEYSTNTGKLEIVPDEYRMNLINCTEESYACY